MRLAPTRATPLFLLAAVAFALTVAVLQVRSAGGGAVATPPAVSAVVLAALAAAVLVVAWPVRRWNAGERDRALDPLRAARTVALAKSAALAGSVMTGAWTGFAVVAVPLVTIPTQPERVATTAAVLLASLALLVAGLVAERWCMIPPEDDDEDRHGHGGGQASPA
ncbi:DUF3180 domain-containing protein [Aquipuribacter sp. SD81]|uniref:DUF3180 domain-containing protein n=1 Tax=Aquipuribacter sp. SD81 TaxID=3127703 RepID=UPI003018280C